MPNYPKWLQIEPIGTWPGTLTTTRHPSQFQSSPSQSFGKLAHELDRLKATNPRIRVAVSTDDLTLDGSRLRAGRTPFHPGVVIVADTPKGTFTIAADYYYRWTDNVHAIALTLEALRAIDRWHVTHGEQFGAFLQIEAARPMPGGGFKSVADAIDYLNEFVDFPLSEKAAPTMIAALIRRALAQTHPDRGGDPDDFQRVKDAENYLRDAGAL